MLAMLANTAVHVAPSTDSTKWCGYPPTEQLPSRSWSIRGLFPCLVKQSTLCWLTTGNRGGKWNGTRFTGCERWRFLLTAKLSRGSASEEVWVCAVWVVETLQPDRQCSRFSRSWIQNGYRIGWSKWSIRSTNLWLRDLGFQGTILNVLQRGFRCQATLFNALGRLSPSCRCVNAESLRAFCFFHRRAKTRRTRGLRAWRNAQWSSPVVWLSSQLLFISEVVFDGFMGCQLVRSLESRHLQQLSVWLLYACSSDKLTWEVIIRRL